MLNFSVTCTVSQIKTCRFHSDVTVTHFSRHGVAMWKERVSFGRGAFTFWSVLNYDALLQRFIEFLLNNNVYRLFPYGFLLKYYKLTCFSELMKFIQIKKKLLLKKSKSYNIL